jgi:hypothetical protein
MIETENKNVDRRKEVDEVIPVPTHIAVCTKDPKHEIPIYQGDSLMHLVTQPQKCPVCGSDMTIQPFVYKGPPLGPSYKKN